MFFTQMEARNSPGINRKQTQMTTRITKSVISEKHNFLQAWITPYALRTQWSCGLLKNYNCEQLKVLAR